jgi:transcription elongation factor Elf1
MLFYESGVKMDTNIRDETQNSFFNCIFCNRSIDKNNVTNSICLDCMASIITRIDIYPDEGYQKFIDFAYNAKNRLFSGESANTIFQDMPDGFEDWLKENFMKTGFGIISKDSLNNKK